MIVLVVTLILLPVVTWWYFSISAPETTSVIDYLPPTVEGAEKTGYLFIQNLVLLAQQPTNHILTDEIEAALSTRLLASINRERLLREVMQLAHMSTLPENGVSIEDVTLIDDEHAQLTIGLNFAHTRSLRIISLVLENMVWKVDAVSTTSLTNKDHTEEPELQTIDDTIISTDPSPTSSRASQPDTLSACYIGGCSNQICSDSPDVATNCTYHKSYECYASATCERQPSGQCGWTETDELLQCLADVEQTVF